MDMDSCLGPKGKEILRRLHQEVKQQGGGWKDVAARCGVSFHTIESLMQGRRRASYWTVEKIARAAGVSDPKQLYH